MTRARTTDDTYTHILTLESGAEIRFRADHGRNYVDLRWPGSRAWNTSPLPPERFRVLSERLDELARVAPGTGGPRA